MHFTRVLCCLYHCLSSNHVTGSPQPQQHEPIEQVTAGCSSGMAPVQPSFWESGIQLEIIDDPQLEDENVKEFKTHSGIYSGLPRLVPRTVHFCCYRMVLPLKLLFTVKQTMANRSRTKSNKL
jgi:hypothetical protein